MTIQIIAFIAIAASVVAAICNIALLILQIKWYRDRQ